MSKIYVNLPYERIDRFVGASTRVIRHFLSVANKYPRHLYKYKQCNADHLRNLMVDSLFYMSSRHQLNDPFDVRSVLDFVDGGINRRNYLNRLFKQFKPRYKDRKATEKRLESPEVIERELRSLLNKSVDSTGVHSFATSPRNLLMWSHYADSHRGVCLVYETAQDLNTFVKALPVEYSRNFPVVSYSDNISGDLIKKAFLTKAIDWKYEQERRIFENDRAEHYLFYEPKALVGIILGSKIDKCGENLIQDLISERRAKFRTELSVYKAVCQESAYAVKIYRA